jgi:hypothetical protein
MVVLLFAVEVEILMNLEPPDREQLFTEAAQAYRKRAVVFQAVGKKTAAQTDLKRAEQLDAEARTVTAKKEADNKTRTGQIRLVNVWTQAVTVLIDGVPYRVEAGEEKTVAHAPGPFNYEVPAAQYKGSAKLDVKQPYLIRIHSQ